VETVSDTYGLPYTRIRDQHVMQQRVDIRPDYHHYPTQCPAWAWCYVPYPFDPFLVSPVAKQPGAPTVPCGRSWGYDAFALHSKAALPPMLSYTDFQPNTCDIFSDVQTDISGRNNTAITGDVAEQPHVVIETSSSFDLKPTRRRVDIDVHITCIADLLQIIDTYEVDVEYNIDLAAMHTIRDELAQINAMVGMQAFKESLVDQLLYFTQGLYLNSDSDYKHMVIYGPPGTGKTQLAKLVGTMYSKLGIIRRRETVLLDTSGNESLGGSAAVAKASNAGETTKESRRSFEVLDPPTPYTFRKVTRMDLVAGYMGQTAIKTKKVIEECIGGCLFIDEVYALGGSGEGGGNCDAYSKECIDTLCESLSDHKDDLMVIVAGYKTQVKELFFGSNPGLESRFMWQFVIDGYTADELRQIFCKKVEHNGWGWATETGGLTTAWMSPKMKDFTHFGRDMDVLFTHTKIAHGRRIFGKSPDQKKRLTMEDMDQGYALFMKQKSSLSSSTTTTTPFGMYI
jgi:hypothetical protein